VPLNTVIISGHLTHDPEVKITKTGMPAVDFQIGVRSSGAAGRSRSHFITIAAFGDLALTVGKLRKGLPIIVEGEVRDSIRLYARGATRQVKLWARHVWRMSEDECLLAESDEAKPAAHSKPPARKRAVRKKAAPKRATKPKT